MFLLLELMRTMGERAGLTERAVPIVTPVFANLSLPLLQIGGLLGGDRPELFCLNV